MNGFAGTANDCLVGLGQIVGEERVRAALPADVVDGVMPRWVVEPASAAEVAGVLALANGTGWAVISRGGGTKLDWGNPPRSADIVLSTRRMDRVIEHAAGDMTATVQAGCTVAEFGRVLAERGQRLAVDPLWPARATIGGILAANDSGALRGTFGGLRDQLIGVTMVLADGTIARSGGKVVKNVAGYDLPKLMIGSFGTLGVIVEAVFRLYPMAKASETLCFGGARLEILLAALEVCSANITAVQVEQRNGMGAQVMVLIEGLVEALEHKAGAVREAAKTSGAIEYERPMDAWTRREAMFAEANTGCVAKVSVLPTLVAALADYLHSMAGYGKLTWRLLIQAMGIGLVRFDGRAGDIAGPMRALRSWTESHGGTMTVLQYPTAFKGRIQVWPEAGDSLELMKRVKEQFDRKGILSPGRFVGGI